MKRYIRNSSLSIVGLIIVVIPTMLPALPKVLITDYQPDVDNFEIFNDSIDWSEIQRTCGVYAFVYKDDGKIAYIGSAAAIGLRAAGLGPLWYRISAYRKKAFGPRNWTEKKIKEEHVKRPLVMRIWFCGSGSDARKYESDAIESIKPPLNKIGTIQFSKKDYQLSEAKRHLEKRKELRIIRFDPAAIKKCKCCGAYKQHSQFSRSVYRIGLVKNICKACFNQKQTQKYASLQRPFDPDATRKCTVCQVSKPCHEFPRNRRRLLGVSQQCKACKNTARNIKRATDQKWRESQNTRRRERHAEQSVQPKYQ